MGEETEISEVHGEEVTAEDQDLITDEDVVAGTLGYLARCIVANPDDVSVEIEETEEGLAFHLKVNNDDLGRVIGRGGRVARAIRTVTRAAAAQTDLQVQIEIDD